MKKLTIAVLGALTALALALPVLAQEYPTFDGDLEVSDSTLTPGQSIRVTGSGFESGALVTITIESDPVELAKATADASGAIDVEVTIPSDFPAGVHTVKATGPAADGGTIVLGTQVTVEGDLSNTGNTIPAGFVVAAAIVGLAGVAAVFASKSASRAN